MLEHSRCKAVLSAFIVCACSLGSRSAAAQAGGSPPPAAIDAPRPTKARLYTLHAKDGRPLHASNSLLWLDTPTDGTDDAQLGFALEPVASDSAGAALNHGDLIRIRAQQGRYLAGFGTLVYLTRVEANAIEWHIVRSDGAGKVEIGDALQFRSRDGRYLIADHSRLVLGHRQTSSSWTLGCYFTAGPHSERWQDRAAFDVAMGPHASNVANAVDWLRAHAPLLQLPTGEFPAVVWDDPTLAPSPTVSYLMIDTLWAIKALEPYDPELSAQMEQGLLSSGWYGNGLADTLFHGYPEPAHRSESEDFVHGLLLDSCSARVPDGADAALVQIRVPEQAVDPAWTLGNSAQFVDSAVYTAVNDFWNGATDDARARLRSLVLDTRDADDDAMFWDLQRGVMVDQASRCDYDQFIGQCSARCSACAPCTGDICLYVNASFKLGLVLYAARLMGLIDDPELAPYFEQMTARLWEAQAADGGVPHFAFYVAPGYYVASSGATGEATSIAVLAHTVLTPAPE